MKKQSVAVNFVMNAFLSASSIIFPLITFPYVSRVLGPSGTGLVASAAALVSYFTLIAMLGIPTYGIRACAAVRDDHEKLSKTAQELLIINLAMGLIAYTLFFVTIYLVPQYSSNAVLYTVCSGAILLNIIGTNWLYQALEQYTYITIASIVFKIIALAMMFMTVQNTGDTVWYGAVTVISGWGSSLVNFIRLRNLIRIRPYRHYNFRRHFKPILTFFGISVAATVYTSLDVLMLDWMKGSEDVGYYNAAVKVKSIMVMVVTSLGTVLLPRLSYYVKNNNEEAFMKLVSKAFSFVLLAAVPLCIYLMLEARETILFLAGDQYLPSVTSMIIITPTILLIGLSNITGIQILVPTGRERAVFYSTLGGAIVDFLINLALIPSLSSAGAAIGTLVAEVAVLIIQVIFLRNILARAIANVEFWPLIISLIPALIVLLLLRTVNIESTFFSLALTAAGFFTIYAAGLLVTREEIIWEFVKRIAR